MTDRPHILADLGAEFERAARQRLTPGSNPRRGIRSGVLVVVAGVLAVAVIVGAHSVLAHRSTPSRPGTAAMRPKFPRELAVLDAVAGQAHDAVIHAELLRQVAESHKTVAPQILKNFAFFAPGARSGRFGHGAAAFTVSSPRFADIPTFVLEMQATLPYVAAAARKVTLASGATVWFIPGDGICALMPPGGGGACSGSLKLALEQGGMYRPVTAPDGVKSYVGVVPNRNKTIAVETTAGATRIIQVADGLFITSSVGLPRFPDFKIKPAR